MYTKEVGNMWDAWACCDHFVITTNAIVKKNGALVMGAGIAKECRDRWPGLDRVLGKRIKSMGPDYGVCLGKKLGIFQVKYHWKDNADLGLIAHSAMMLALIAKSRPDERFDLNFPGIGNGKLKYEDVEPELRILPENVHVWTFR